MSTANSKMGKRLVRSKSGLKIVAQHEHGMAPWEIGEPQWQPDKDATHCNGKECSTKFDFIKRKHHCRRCGLIFCSKCCGTKVQFYRMQFVDPVRHCLDCAQISRREEHFFDQSLKILFGGVLLKVRLEDSPAGDESAVYYVKLSTDQKCLLFDCHKGEGDVIEPVLLARLTDLSVELSSTDDHGTSQMDIRVKRPQQGQFGMNLRTPDNTNQNASMQWIRAFKEAMGMVFESRNNCETEMDNRSDEQNEEQ